MFKINMLENMHFAEKHVVEDTCCITNRRIILAQCHHFLGGYYCNFLLLFPLNVCPNFRITIHDTNFMSQQSDARDLRSGHEKPSSVPLYKIRAAE